MFGFQSKLTLALKVADLSARNAQLAAENSRIHANMNWLMLHVNELKLERAELLARVFGIQVPVAQVESAASQMPPQDTTLPGIDANYKPSPLSESVPHVPSRPSGDLIQRARDIAEAAKTGKDIRPAVEAALSSGLFEDPGDDVAKELGIEHGPGGELLYTR